MFEYRVVWRRADGSEVVSAVMSLATAQEYAVMPTTSGTVTLHGPEDTTRVTEPAKVACDRPGGGL